MLTLLLLCLPASLFLKTWPEEPEWPGTLIGRISYIEPDGKKLWLTDTNFPDIGIILVSFEAETSYSIGNTIRIDHQFKIQKPEAPSNPGQFDAQTYYQTKGIDLLCYAKGAVCIDDTVRPVANSLYKLRKFLSSRMERLFPEDKSGILQAMLLGDKTDLEAETKSLYQKSGISHLLAISGLHVSIFGMGLYNLLRKVGGSLKLSGLASLALVLLYGFLTGMGTSTCRAVVMFAILMNGQIWGKSYDMLSALAFAAILLLMKEPLYVRSASFLLSFGAVAGIGIIFPALKQLFLPQNRKIVKRIEPLLLSLSIQLMTLPMLEYFYCEIPLYGTFLNLIVIPLMTVVMVTGIAAVLVSFLSMSVASLPAFFCSGILDGYEILGNFSLKLPGSVYTCGQPALWQLLLYYGGLLLFLLWRHAIEERKKRKLLTCLDAEEAQEEKEKPEPHRRRRQLASSIILATLAGFLTLRLHTGMELVMLDVGQGDGIFLRTASGTTFLIDGGSTSVSKVGTYRILPFLKAEGAGSLDYIVVTHTDADHISGIQELLEEAGKPGGFHIGSLLLSGRSLEEEKGQELLEMAEKCGAKVQKIGYGNVLQDESTRLFCLHPNPEESYEDVNVASVVLAVTYEDFSVLLTGDLEEAGEEEILMREEKNGGKEWPEKGFSILKAGHHGSKTSGSEAWLRVVKPYLTLISCGKDNSYGHPHKEALERLISAGSRILQTTECGAITVKSDGQEFRVQGFLENQS